MVLTAILELFSNYLKKIILQYNSIFNSYYRTSSSWRVFTLYQSSCSCSAGRLRYWHIHPSKLSLNWLTMTRNSLTSFYLRWSWINVTLFEVLTLILGLLFTIWEKCMNLLFINYFHMRTFNKPNFIKAKKFKL